MKIGEFEVAAIEAGRFRLDGGAMFGVVPKVLWERSNPADEKNRIDMALRLCLIQGGDRTILVDTGIGDKWNDRQKEMYGIENRKLPLDPNSVTDVILTHLHFDHVGGATGLSSEGKPFLTFPNATYYVQEANLKHAHAPTEKDKASFIETTIDPLKESGKLALLNGETEIVPGVQILVTHGHTPGHQLVKVSDGKTTLLVCGDTIPTASHVPIPWVMAYDLEPLVTMEEKRRLLRQAVDENWILFYVHDPFIAASHVLEKDGRFLKGSSVF